MVGLAFAIAASANFPALVLSIFWRRFTTRGAQASMIVGTRLGAAADLPLAHDPGERPGARLARPSRCGTPASSRSRSRSWSAMVVSLRGARAGGRGGLRRGPAARAPRPGGGRVAVPGAGVNAVLLISCPDQKGLVAAVSDFVYRHDGNIRSAEQQPTSSKGSSCSGSSGTSTASGSSATRSPRPLGRWRSGSRCRGSCASRTRWRGSPSSRRARATASRTCCGAGARASFAPRSRWRSATTPT